MEFFTTRILKGISLVGIFMIGSFVNAQDFEWVAGFGGNGDDFGQDVVSDAEGNVYSTGYFFQTTDFDPGTGIFELTSPDQQDMYVSKLDENGDFVWAHRFGNTDRNRGNAITIDEDTNIYVTGYFEGTVDFDPSSGTEEITSIGVVDMFILKLDKDGEFVWVNHIGGSGAEEGRGLSVDNNGNLIATGYFTGTADFDIEGAGMPMTSAGARDPFVIKYDNSGSLIWVKQFEGTGDGYAGNITTDVNNNIYCTGFFNDDFDFDPGSSVSLESSNGDKDIYVVKLDENGDYEWSASAGGTGDDRGNGIAVNDTGQVFITGRFDLTVDFDPGAGTSDLVTSGGREAFIWSLNSNGNLLWVNGIGGSSNDEGYDLSIDSNGDGVCNTGFFSGTADFDGSTQLNTQGGSDTYVLKMDYDGNLVWLNQIGGSSSEFPVRMFVGDNWDTYVTGYFSGITDFDPTNTNTQLTAVDGDDAFVYKVSQQCNQATLDSIAYTDTLLCPNLGSTTELIARGDLNDAVNWKWFVDGCGQTEVASGDTVVFTPTTTTTFYVRAEGACGTLPTCDSITVYVQDQENPTITAPADLTIYLDSLDCSTSPNLGTETTDDNCVVDTVYNDAPTSFDIGSTTVIWTVEDESGNMATAQQLVVVEDTFAPQLDPAELDDVLALCELTAADAPTATDHCAGQITGTTTASFPITTSQTITWTFEDGNGNSTTQDQEVIIEYVDVSVSVDEITLTANNSTLGVFYRWVDCDDNYSPITNATNQSFTPEENGNYAVVILQDDCQDTSDCIEVSTVGLDDYTKTNVNVYPNPSTGEFNIELASSDAVNYTVTDNTGRIVRQGSFEDLENTIDLSAEEKGLYFLSIDGGVKKLVVQ